LETLFESVALQKVTGLECLVIDQNADDRLGPILARWQERLTIRRLRGEAGASRSRNLGLAHATGDIVAFPDDDCWYSAGLLEEVAGWFEQHPEFGILTVGARDVDGVASGNRWPQDRCEIRAINAFRTTFCSSIFLRGSVAHGARFDEAMGPGAGTPWSCGEETDYLLQLCDQGVRGYFDRRWHVGHPKRDMLSGEIDSRRAGGYGRGMGRVLHKHSLYLLGAAFVAYDVLRAGAVLLKGHREAAVLCLQHAKGVATGLVRSEGGGANAGQEKTFAA
jgi:glycosyltransferase involved in cell wall biosynthesis